MTTVSTGTAGGGPLNLGSAAPGGLINIHDNSNANPTVVTTTLPHGLTSLDSVYFTNSDSNAVINGERVITRTGDYTFTVPVNCGAGAGTNATTMSQNILDISVATAALVTCGAPHGLRPGDTVTIAGTDSTPVLDGVQTVLTTPTTRTFTVGITTTIVGTVGYFTKTTYYLDVVHRGDSVKGGAVVITSTIGEAPKTVTVNIQGSFDGSNWFNVPYALVATPRTFVITALTITTATTTTYLLQETVPYRFLRLACSSATNVALSAVAYIGA